jgi:hypothetical protein
MTGIRDSLTFVTRDFEEPSPPEATLGELDQTCATIQQFQPDSAPMARRAFQLSLLRFVGFGFDDAVVVDGLCAPPRFFNAHADDRAPRRRPAETIRGASSGDGDVSGLKNPADGGNLDLNESSIRRISGEIKARRKA